MSRESLRKRVARILETRAYTCPFPRCGMQHLPAELIVNILNELSAKEVALWQCVSRQFRDLIADSVTLQYKIECCVSDVFEEPFCLDRNKAEQIEAMREWRRAWKNFEWKLELTEDSAPAQSISLDNPPSIIRGALQKACNLDLRQYAGYGYDADANVIIVAKPDPNFNTIELLPLDPVTGERHPKHKLNADPMILELEDYPDFPLKLNVIVHGDSVMCYTDAEEDHPRSTGFSAEHWWFSWPEGCARMNIWTDYDSVVRLDDFTFLTERFIAITVFDEFTGLLAVFKAEDCEPELLTVEESLTFASALLELPSLGEEYVLRSLPVECKPKHPRLPATYRDALFTPANTSAVVRVQLPVEHFPTGREIHFDLLIPRSVILQHAQLGPAFDDHEEIIYTKSSKWCHKGRLFRAFSVAKGAVFGSRYITKEPVKGGQSVVAIYDFRPSPTTLYDLGRDEDVDIVFEDDWVVSDMFAESQRTSAPYRRMKSDIILGHDEYPQLTEDGIVIVDGTHPKSCRTRVYCF